MLSGPDLVQEMMDKVRIIRDRIKAAQDRQKSYADLHRRENNYEVGDRSFLKFLPGKEQFILEKKGGKLSPRFIGTYEVSKKIGPVAYRLNLPLKSLKSTMSFMLVC